MYLLFMVFMMMWWFIHICLRSRACFSYGFSWRRQRKYKQILCCLKGIVKFMPSSYLVFHSLLPWPSCAMFTFVRIVFYSDHKLNITTRSAQYKIQYKNWFLYKLRRTLNFACYSSAYVDMYPEINIIRIFNCKCNR